METQNKNNEDNPRTAQRNKIKSILGYLGYIITVIASFFQGYVTRRAVLPVYPYSRPQPIGWIGPGSFLAMFGTIGGLILRKPKSAIQKRRNWQYLGFIIAGIGIFVAGLIFGIKNSEIFSAGVDYGVYSKQKKEF